MGVLQPQPGRPRVVLVLLDDRGRGGLEGELPALDDLPERVQEPGRPGDHRLRFRVHLKTYGFGYIRELELLQEAGFHPLEVVRAATLHGAEALGLEAEIGSVEPGKLADLVVVEENPLANFKVLYGTGAIRVNEDNEPVRVGGVRYTIKDGIVYDARELLADVREIVRAAKEETGFVLRQPGIPATD